MVPRPTLCPHCRGAGSASATASAHRVAQPCQRQAEKTPRRDGGLVRQFDPMVIAEGLDWLALNKPSGLAVQGGTGTNTHIDGMLMALADGNEEARLRLVHRIDKDTSGILLLAKNRAAARRLSDDFHHHRIAKTYLALVVGIPKPVMQIRHRLEKQMGEAVRKWS